MNVHLNNGEVLAVSNGDNNVELFTMRLEREHLFAQNRQSHGKHWAEIVADYNSKNSCNLSVEKAKMRFKNACTTYKVNKKNELRTGTGSITWPYFELFNSFLGKKSNICPDKSSLISSIATVESSGQNSQPISYPSSQTTSMNESIELESGEDTDDVFEPPEHSYASSSTTNESVMRVRRSSTVRRGNRSRETLISLLQEMRADDERQHRELKELEERKIACIQNLTSAILRGND